MTWPSNDRAPGLDRRGFVKTLSAAALGAAAHQTSAETAAPGRPGDTRQTPPASDGPLDRRALVTRHNVTLDRIDPLNPLQVGNGEFAFACDVTGLQTLDENLGTYSQWGWHTFPNPLRLKYEDSLEEFDSGGRVVKYPCKVDISTGLPQTPPTAGDWYRRSPHRFHLGRIGFALKQADGSPGARIAPERVVHTLDLWSGTIRSRYRLAGRPVEVTTCVHPQLDLLAVRVRSPLLAARRLSVSWRFPYTRFADAHPSWDPADEDKHRTVPAGQGGARAVLRRIVGADEYSVAIAWSTPAEFRRTGAHEFELAPTGGAGELAFVTHFATARGDELPDFEASAAAAGRHWADFWNSGGAVDLSASRDPRWRELERRIVLAQYLTAIQTCGSAPPQESGLFSNSWYGKFHLEMLSWHGVHYLLWGRGQLLDGWRRWMRETGLPAARRLARDQGYAGARWMKMIDRDASWDSPSSIAPFRLTQNGHVIYLAELQHRFHPGPSTLAANRDLVFETAEFMADFVRWDEATKRYLLGPPLFSGSEATIPPARAFNPTVELSYWFYGLRTAQEWRERHGLPRVAKWDRVLAHLSKPAVENGRYLDCESHPGQWNGRPAWLEAYGCMPGVGIDPAVISRNYEAVAADYEHWPEVWGCDFPMLAMTAARLGRAEDAVGWLLSPNKKNEYQANGFNVAGSTPYLPAHGGLLWAVAMMAAGWDGAPSRHAPGFPENAGWIVRWEGLLRVP